MAQPDLSVDLVLHSCSEANRRAQEPGSLVQEAFSHGVLLDGQPILSWDRMELGPHIGYLPQDIELFDGSIAENIARAGEVVSEKVIAAADASGLHQMIL